MIRARLKPVSEMPEWAVCCDQRRQRYAALQGQELTVEAYSRVSIEPMTCLWCGKVTVFGKGKMTSDLRRAPVELYDLDEGLL